MRYFLTFFVIVAYLTSFSQKNRLGLNLYLEKGYEFNGGLAVRYGKNGYVRYHQITPRKLYSSRVVEPRKSTSTFQGVLLKLNHSFQNSWHQLELGYQSSKIITWGILVSNVNYLNESSFGLKPLIGFSLYNFELS